MGTYNNKKRPSEGRRKRTAANVPSSRVGIPEGVFRKSKKQKTKKKKRKKKKKKATTEFNGATVRHSTKNKKTQDKTDVSESLYLVVFFSFSKKKSPKKKKKKKKKKS